MKKAEKEVAVADDAGVVVQMSDFEPRLTVERFARTLSDQTLASSFVRIQRLKGKTERKTKADWQSEFDKFKSSPRW